MEYYKELSLSSDEQIKWIDVCEPLTKRDEDFISNFIGPKVWGFQIAKDDGYYYLRYYDFNWKIIYFEDRRNLITFILIFINKLDEVSLNYINSDLIGNKELKAILKSRNCIFILQKLLDNGSENIKKVILESLSTDQYNDIKVLFDLLSTNFKLFDNYKNDIENVMKRILLILLEPYAEKNYIEKYLKLFNLFNLLINSDSNYFKLLDKDNNKNEIVDFIRRYRAKSIPLLIRLKKKTIKYLSDFLNIDEIFYEFGRKINDDVSKKIYDFLEMNDLLENRSSYAIACLFVLSKYDNRFIDYIHSNRKTPHKIKGFILDCSRIMAEDDKSENLSQLDKVISKTLKIFPKIRFDDIDSIRKILYLELNHLFYKLSNLGRIDLDVFIETLYFKVKNGHYKNLSFYINVLLEVGDGDLSIENNYLLYASVINQDKESFILLIQHPSIYESETIISDFESCILIIKHLLSENELKKLINLFYKKYNLYAK